MIAAKSFERSFCKRGRFFLKGDFFLRVSTARVNLMQSAVVSSFCTLLSYFCMKCMQPISASIPALRKNKVMRLSQVPAQGSKSFQAKRHQCLLNCTSILSESSWLFTWWHINSRLCHLHSAANNMR